MYSSDPMEGSCYGGNSNRFGSEPAIPQSSRGSFQGNSQSTISNSRIDELLQLALIPSVCTSDEPIRDQTFLEQLSEIIVALPWAQSTSRSDANQALTEEVTKDLIPIQNTQPNLQANIQEPETPHAQCIPNFTTYSPDSSASQLAQGYIQQDFLKCPNQNVTCDIDQHRPPEPGCYSVKQQYDLIPEATAGEYTAHQIIQLDPSRHPRVPHRFHPYEDCIPSWNAGALPPYNVSVTHTGSSNITPGLFDPSAIIAPQPPVLTRSHTCYEVPESIRLQTHVEGCWYKDGKQWRCLGATCGLVFKNKMHAEAHIYSHHFGIKVRFRCNNCTMATLWGSSAQRHEKIGEKAVVCNYCGKPLSRSNYAEKTHIRHCREVPDDVKLATSRSS